MNTATLALLLCIVTLPALAQTTDDQDMPVQDVHVSIHCTTNTGKCKAPPVPPAPPAPPVPPAPPPPPKLPPVPSEAHAACAGKATGSPLTWSLGEGEIMKGVCAKHHGKMVFVLRSYELNG